jgi:hypothetical protein
VSGAEGGFVALADLLRQKALTPAASLPASSAVVSPLPGASLDNVACAQELGRAAGPRATGDTVQAAVPESTLDTEAQTQRRLGSPSDSCGCDRADALRVARRFRAAVAEALDDVVDRLSRALAAEVLGRELRLGAADLATIARRIVEEWRAEEPLRLRVAPDVAIECEIPVVGDPHLMPGDAILECRSGEIDARLAVRLSGALTAVQR